jgi:microcystin-dependent protein
MYGGSGAPANWLLCDGTAISRTAFSALFSIISTFYGAGDGTSTFNLPNLKQRVAVGQDTSTTWAATLGQAGGEVNHTLLTAEMAAHTHSASASQGSHNHGDNGHQHYCSGVDHLHGVPGVDHLHGDDHQHGIPTGQFSHNHGDPGHSHSFSTLGGGGGVATGSGFGAVSGTTGVSGTGIQPAVLPGGITNYKSQQGFGATTGAADRSLNTTSNAADRSLAFYSNISYASIAYSSAGPISVSEATIGSNTPHNNLPPFLVVNYIIKT